MKTRLDLMTVVPQHGRCVELGVGTGAFTIKMAEARPWATVLAVDAWAGDGTMGAEHGEQEYLETLQRLRSFEQVIVLRARFEEVARLAPDGWFDFVYVDGYAHTGQDAGATLDAWWPKVRNGGLFAGHDYDAAWPATVDAVDMFFDRIQRDVEVLVDEETYDGWWVIK